MKIVIEYRQVYECLETVKSKIKTSERELEKLINSYAPSNVKGFDYSNHQVQSSMVIQNIEDIAVLMSECNDRLKLLRHERDQLEIQLKELEQAIEILNETSYKVILLKIKGRSNRQIAYEMNYSKRQIERIVKESFEIIEKELAR